MVVLYMAAGLLFLLTGLLSDYIHKWRPLIGFSCLAYAAWRGYIIWKKIRHEKDQNR